MNHANSERRSGRALLVAEVLLGALLVVSPLALGTVQYWSFAVTLALASGALVAMLCARPKLPAWPMLAAAAVTAFVGLQAVPLPPSLCRLVSPHGAELWGYAGVTGWHPLSLDPSATAREFARLFTCTAAFAVASRLASDSTVARRIARVIAAMGFAQCAFVLFHAAIATRRVYGIVDVTLPQPLLGTIANRNYLAGYLTATIPLVVAAALRSPRWRWAWLCGAAGIAVIVVLSGSRSGLAGLATVTALTWLYARRFDDAAAALPWATALALVALPCLAGVAGLVATGRTAQFNTLMHPALLLKEEKVAVWRDVPALIHDYWATGIGRGSFEEVFFAYKRHADWMTFTHVENAPLQLFADLGLIAGALVIAAWLAALWRAHRDDSSFVRKAAFASLVSLTVHELGDFSLDGAGAVALLAATLWGLACPAGRTISRRWIWPLAGSSLLLAGAASAALWTGYRGDLHRDLAALDAGAKQPLEPLLSQLIARHPAEPWFNFSAGRRLLVERKPGQALRYFNRAMLLDPKGWRAHIGAGEALLMAGRSGQAPLEFRSGYALGNYGDEVPLDLLSHRGLNHAEAFRQFGGDDVTVLQHLAPALERAGRFPLAESAALHLLELAPTDAEAHRLVARLAERAARWDAVLAQTEALGPADTGGTLMRVAALDHLGRRAEADDLLEQRAPADTTMTLPMALAARELDQKHGARAAELLARIDAARVPPDSLSHLHALMARAAEMQGRTREALVEYNTAARLDPSDAGRLELGAAYERAGMMRPAILVYRNLAHSSSVAQARLRALDALPAEGPAITGGAPAALPGSPLDVLGDTPPGDDKEKKENETEGSDETDEEQ